MPLRRNPNGTFSYSPDPQESPRPTPPGGQVGKGSDIERLLEVYNRDESSARARRRGAAPDFSEFTSAFEQLGRPSDEPAGRPTSPFTGEVRARAKNFAQSLISGEYDRLLAEGLTEEEAGSTMQERLGGLRSQIPQAPTPQNVFSPAFWADRLYEGVQHVKAAFAGPLEGYSHTSFALEPFEPGDRFRAMRTRRPQFTPEQREQIDRVYQEASVRIQEEAMAAYAASAAEWEPDILRNPFEFIVGHTLRMLPLTSFSLVTGALTGGMGAGPGISMAAAGGVGFATSYYAERAFLVDELVNEGLTREDALAWASAAAVPIAAMESAFDVFLGGLSGDAAARLTGRAAISEMAKRTAAKRLSAVAKAWAASSGIEGSTEGVQELMAAWTVYLATGEMPEGLSQRVMDAILAGSAAGGGIAVFPAGVGQAAEHRRVGKWNKAFTEAARNDFDPALVPPGTTINGATKGVDKNGKDFWYTRDENGRFKFAATPTSDEYIVETVTSQKEETSQAALTAAIDPKSPLGMSFKGGLEEIFRITGVPQERVEPLTNIAYLSSVYYIGTARSLVTPSEESGITPISEEEALERAARFETFALDPESGLSPEARAQSLGRSLALQEAVATAKGRQPSRHPSNVSQLDLAVGAYHLSKQEAATLAELTVQAETRQDEAMLELIRRGKWIQENKAATDGILKESDELASTVRLDEVLRSRGVGPGSAIITADGTVAQVLDVERSGVLIVADPANPETPIRLNPESVNVKPEVGTYVQAGGLVGRVASLLDDRAVVDIPGKGRTELRFQEIDLVGNSKPMREALEKVYNTAVAALPAPPPTSKEGKKRKRGKRAAPAAPVTDATLPPAAPAEDAWTPPTPEEILAAHAADPDLPPLSSAQTAEAEALDALGRPAAAAPSRPRRRGRAKRGSAAVQEAQEATAATVKRSAAAAQPIPTTTTLPDGSTVFTQPIRVRDTRTGEEAAVVSSRPDGTVVLHDGSVVPASQVGHIPAIAPLAGARPSDPIPVFAAGTRPSSPSTKINFVLIPNESRKDFERAIRLARTPEQVAAAFEEATAEVYLFPQTRRSNKTQYAIEIPEAKRLLTPAAKRLLGALGGKGLDKVSNNSMRSRVKLTRDITTEEMSVARVPDALLAPVDYTNDFFNSLSAEDKLAYMRRLTDLGFELDNTTADLIDASDEVSTIKAAAVEEHLVGSPGASELLTIQARSRTVDAITEHLQVEAEELAVLHEEIRTALQTLMTPRERQLIDALNASERSEMIESLKGTGVGPVVIDQIIASRESSKGLFKDWEDVVNRSIPKLGAAKLASLRSALEEGIISYSDPIEAAVEGRIAALLRSLPADDATSLTPFQLSYSHPLLPGFKLLISKTSVPTSTTPLTPEQLRAIAQQAPAFESFTPEQQAQVLAQVREAMPGLFERQPTSRTTYQLSFIAPDTNRQVLFRNFSHGTNEVGVPYKYSFGGRADEKIASVLAAGGTFDQAVEEMRGEAVEGEVVYYAGAEVTAEESGEFLLIDEERGGENVWIQKLVDPAKQHVPPPLRVPASEVRLAGRQKREPMRTIKVSYRMSEDEMLAELMRETRSFGSKASLISMGEYRSSIPYIYADIKPIVDGSFLVTMMKHTPGASGTVRSGEIYTTHYESSHAAAEEWLAERGFTRAISFPDTGGSVKTLFGSLPHIYELSESNLPEVHDRLTKILHFHIEELGFAPQPLVDYAQRFTRRYRSSRWSLPNIDAFLGGRRNRNAVGVTTLSEHYNIVSRPAARAVQTEGAQDVSISDQVLLSGATSGQEFFTPAASVATDVSLSSELPNPKQGALAADDLAILDRIGPSGAIIIDSSKTPASVEQIREVQALQAKIAHNERFADIADLDFEGQPSLRRLSDRLVRITSTGQHALIISPNYGGDTIVVQFIGPSGTTSIAEIPKDDAERVRSKKKVMNYYRNAKNALGELQDFPATQPLGLSPYDRQLGLHGVEDPAAYTKGLKRYISNILKSISISPDGIIRGDITPLVPAWIRMHEMGISNEIPGTRPAFVEPSAQPVVRYTFQAMPMTAVERGLGSQERELHLEKTGKSTYLDTRSGVEYTYEKGEGGRWYLIHPIGSGRLPAFEVLSKPKRYDRTKDPALSPEERARGPEVRTPEFVRPPLERGKTLIPTELSLTLNRLAMDELTGQYSGNSAFGSLMARAKLGQLGRQTTRDIEAQAEEFGLDRNAPLWEKIEYLMQYVWDPNVAETLWERRRTLGTLWWSENASVPDLRMEFSIPTTGRAARMAVLSQFTFPRTVADMHPVFRYFFHRSEAVRTKYSNDAKEAADVIGWLQGWGKHMSLERKETIMDILSAAELGALKNSPGDILSRDDILSALSPEDKAKLEGWDWYTQYEELSVLLRYARESIIRQGLLRGFGVNFIDIPMDDEGNPTLTPGAMIKLLHDHGLNASEIEASLEAISKGSRPVALDRTSHPSNQKPRAEIEAFIELLRNYSEFDLIPASVQATMPAWMKDEFNFWQRYGIKNYVPLISQGKHKLFIKRNDGSREYFATVSNLEEAELIVFKLSRGEVPGWSAEDANSVVFALGSHRVDELDQTFLGPTRFKKLYSNLRKHLADEKKASAIVSDILGMTRLSSERATPRNLHQLRRDGDLVQVIEDPYQRIMMYLGRAYRGEYMLGIEQAYETSLGMDDSISRAAGLSPFYKNESSKSYAIGLRDSYMGRTTTVEREMSKLLAMVTSGMSLIRDRGPHGRRLLKYIKSQKATDPNYSPWEDPSIVNWATDPDRVAQHFSQHMIALQSVLRLGFNLGAAGVNSLQHVTVTPAYLVTQGASPTEALNFTLAAYKDSLAYRQQRLELRAWERGGHHGPRPKADLVDFVRSAGTLTVPMRETGGPGLQLSVRNRPMRFYGEKLSKTIGAWGTWAAMSPFSLAEDSVRLASTFAGMRLGQAKGLKGDALVTFARETVDNTQFQYYDQALPPFMRGSVMKMLFQFAQYPVNMIKFEVDLIKGMVPQSVGFSPAFGQLRGQEQIYDTKGRLRSANRQAALAQLMYLTNGFIFGGTSWVMSRGFAQLAMRLLGLRDDWEREEASRSELNSPEDPRTEGNKLWGVENFVNYGAPGLLSIYLSNRMGVHGLMPVRFGGNPLAIGPTGALFYDTYKVLFGEDGFHTVSSAPKAALGALAGQWLTGRMNPYSLLTTPLLTSFLWSQGEQLLSDGSPTFYEFLGLGGDEGTVAGRTYIHNAAPVLARGAVKTMEIFGQGDYSSVEDFWWSMENPSDYWHDPGFGAYLYAGGFDRLWESAAALTGFQTVPSAEERVFSNYLRKSQKERALLKRTLIDLAASKHSNPEVSQGQLEEILAAWARIYDVDISDKDIQDELNRRSLSNIERIREQGARDDWFRTSPSLGGQR